MPLWSLTQERVEKLRRQIGQVEMEVDTLIKLSKEDLWKRDLDLFIEEWRVQLDEEYKRKRRINNMGRRASRKVNVGATGPTVKKRKGLGDHSDDEFEERPKTKKPAAPKAKRKEVLVEKKIDLKGWLASGNGTQGKNSVNRNHDGNSSEAEPEQPKAASTTAEVKKVKPTAKPKTVEKLQEDSDLDEVVKKPAARKARAAASKPLRYAGESDSDDSNGDDLLGDITNMVKGLPGGESKSTNTEKSLFSTSRALPNGSASLKPALPAATKSYAEISDDDDTNFMALVPQQSPRRSINVTKNALLTDEDDEDEDDIRPLTTNKSHPQAAQASKPAPAPKAKPAVKSESESKDDDDDDDIVITKTKPRPAPSTSKATAASKPAPKPAATKKAPAPSKKSTVKSKTTSAPAAKKPLPLSPAAKAYAAKQAKNIQHKNDRLLGSDDEADAIDAMADDLLNSPVSATAVKHHGDEGSDAGNSSPPPQAIVGKKPAAPSSTAGGRPARRAAATAAKKKPVYVLSDDDDEESDGAEFGAQDGDEESEEADFDDSD
jgi:DNA topoisomerase II